MHRYSKLCASLDDVVKLKLVLGSFIVYMLPAYIQMLKNFLSIVNSEEHSED